MPHAAFVLACLCLAACDVRRPADPPEGEMAGVAPGLREFYEEERKASEPRAMTRQEALAEYRKCTHRTPSENRNLCRRWMDLAYPPSSHMLNDAPEPPGRGGNTVPVTDELLKAMHTP